MCSDSFVALRTNLIVLLGCVVVAALAPMSARAQRSFTSETWGVPNQWGSSGYTWVADFDGDGKADIASANRSNVYMHFSRGDRFENKTWSVPDRWGSSGYTWVADFDGDGKADIASADDDNVEMHFSGDNGFVNETWIAPGWWGGSEYTWVADFDGDGKADIASTDHGDMGAISTATESRLYMHFSRDHGFETKTWRVPNKWGGSGYTWVADFDGDGKADIATVPGDDDVKCWIRNTCVVLHTAAGSTAFDGFWNDESDVLPLWDSVYSWAADFDGDGKAEIASANGGILVTHTFAGNGLECEAIAEPCISESHRWRITKSGCGHSSPCGDSAYIWLADFDGDGKPDIASKVGRDVVVTHLSRSGGFENLDWKVADAWGAPGYTWAADFDGDGKADIASANGGHVYMKLSTPPPPPPPPPPPDNLTPPVSLRLDEPSAFRQR